ncbi:hypothetical protein CsSME_00030412 [Camellia sinensis var. sinensis]
MALFVSSAMSARTTPFCACGFGMCVVKISRSSRNSGCAYYQCPHIVIDKNVVKFKTKLLEHAELMRRMYEGATTTGNFAWTLGADFDPVATDDIPSLMDAEDCAGLIPCKGIRRQLASATI